MRSLCQRFSEGIPKMSDNNDKEKHESWLMSFGFTIAGMGLLIFALLFFNGCAEPQIVKINVPTPCEVQSIPKEPKAVDLENASVGFVMEYVRDIVQYAKEVRPIIRECVREKSISKSGSVAK